MAKNVIDATLRFVDKFTSPFKNAITKCEQNIKKLNQTSKDIARVGKNVSKIGGTLTKSLTLPLVGAGTAAVKVASDFEAAMSNVKAIGGATKSEFKKLENEAISLGASTAFSSVQVADAMTEMSKAGWDAQQVIDGMSGVLDAAAASGEELSTVSTIVADAITGFGMKAKDSTRVADLLTQAANAGTIDIADLGETFKYISPVANAMKMSIEDITTAVSAMSMAGIKGSEAGTSLRTLLTNLIRPSDDMAAVMEKLNISAANQDGTMKSLDEIVANLRNSFSGLTEEERSKNAAILAGKTGLSGLQALLNLTEKEYNALAESMDNCKGVADKTARVMQDNLNSKVEQLTGSLESLGIKLGGYVIPALTKITVRVTDVVNKFTELDESTQKTILKVTGVVAAIGPTLLIAGKIITMTAGIIKFAASVGTMIKMIKAGTGALRIMAVCGPVMSVGLVTGIAAVVAGVALLIKNWDKIKPKLVQFGNYTKNAFNKAGFSTKHFSQKFASMKDKVADIIDNLKVIFAKILPILKPISKFVVGVFFFAIKDTFNRIVGVANALCKSISDTIDNILTIFDGITKFIKGVFTADWKLAFDGLKEIVKGAFSSMVGLVKTPLNTIIGLVNGSINSINSLSFDVPEWVPGIGGNHIGFSIPTIPMLYKGTNNWGGGLAEINEPKMGGEIVNLPSGSQIIPHDKSLKKAYREGKKDSSGKAVTKKYIFNINKMVTGSKEDAEEFCKMIMDMLDNMDDDPEFA